MMPPIPNEIPKQRTRIGWGARLLLTAVLLLIIALAIFLLIPSDSAMLPPWFAPLQAQTWFVVSFLSPYLVVALLGGIVGLAELTATFQTYPREALQTRWARILVLVNMLAAVLALLIVQAAMPATNVLLQVIGVGIGFQAIIRTKFILAKPMNSGFDNSSNGEVSVNLGWIYDQFQNLCRTQIDLELMNNRRTAVTHLIKYYPSLAELYDIAWYTIIARATLTPDEENVRLERLEKLLDPKAPENFARTSIALMVLENGGQAYVDLLLTQANATAEPEAAQLVQKPEMLVREMVEKFSLESLVQIASGLTDNEKILTWIRNAAKPVPETSEASQKAAIAHFMLQQIGVEPVYHAVKGHVPSVMALDDATRTAVAHEGDSDTAV